MFAPNSKPCFHHRSASFHELVLRSRAAFLRLAGLGEEWEVVFMTGSGALALESVVYTARRCITPLFVQKAASEFSRRLADLTFVHGKHAVGSEDVAYVQYETSTSELNISGWKAKGITIVDCVSSFPYYLPPDDADIIVTVSGKQLEAAPGIAIIAVHPRVYDTNFFFADDQHASYLNLNRHLHYASRKNETPNTPAITVLQDLCTRMEGFDRSALIERVNYRYSALKARFSYFGELPMASPPVYTFPKRLEQHDAFGLYGKNRTQLFLWHAGDLAEAAFEGLLKNLKG